MYIFQSNKNILIKREVKQTVNFYKPKILREKTNALLKSNWFKWKGKVLSFYGK